MHLLQFMQIGVNSRVPSFAHARPDDHSKHPVGKYHSEFVDWCNSDLTFRNINDQDSLLIGNELTAFFGHMAAGIGLRAKAVKLGIIPNRYRIFYSKTANEYLQSRYFSQLFPTSKVNELIYICKEFVENHRFERIHYVIESGKANPLYSFHTKVESDWIERFGVEAPLLTVSNQDVEYQNQLKRKLGILNQTKILVLHHRNDGTRNPRNCNFINYIPTIIEAMDNGWTVIYFGDQKCTEEFLLNHPMFINYAQSPFRSARNDIAILAMCDGVVATTGGLKMVASLFGKPLLWTNAVGSSRYLLIQNCQVLPKLISRNRSMTKILTLPDQISLGDACFFESIPENWPFYLRENSSEEILEAFLDKFERGGEQKPLENQLNLKDFKISPVVNSFVNRYNFL